MTPRASGLIRLCSRAWRLFWLPRGWFGVLRPATDTREAVSASSTDHGVTDDGVPGKAIYLREGLTRLDLLETLLHEGLHACAPTMDEEWVDDAARGLTHLIERFGRWEPKEDTPVRKERT